MDQVKQLFEKSNVPAAKLWGANFKSGEEWKLSFNYSENDDDIFRIASMTKLLTTIGSLQLVEKGKLNTQRCTACIILYRPQSSSTSPLLVLLFLSTFFFCYYTIAQ